MVTNLLCETLQDEPDEEYDNDTAYADNVNAIKEFEKEENVWSETSRLCSDLTTSESADTVDIPDDKKVLFAKQESLCKEVSDHLAKVQRQKEILQFGKSFEATRTSIRSKYEESNAKYEALQLQIPSN